jgi:hypothetical protein
MTPAAQLQAWWEIMTIPCHARRQWRPAVNVGRDAPMTVGGHHGRVRHQLLGRGPDDRGLESTTRRFRDWTALGCTIFRAAIDSRSTAREKLRSTRAATVRSSTCGATRAASCGGPSRFGSPPFGSRRRSTGNLPIISDRAIDNAEHAAGTLDPPEIAPTSSYRHGVAVTRRKADDSYRR